MQNIPPANVLSALELFAWVSAIVHLRYPQALSKIPALIIIFAPTIVSIFFLVLRMRCQIEPLPKGAGSHACAVSNIAGLLTFIPYSTGIRGKLVYTCLAILVFTAAASTLFASLD